MNAWRPFRIPVCLGLVFLAGSEAAPGAPPFSVVDGLALFETEDYTANLSPRSSHQWEFANQMAGYSGTGYMEGTPDTDAIFTNWPTTSPELQYEVVFPTNGIYRVWIRAYGTGGTSDSVHWGLDGKSNAVGISWSTYNAWIWATNASGAPATLTVTSAGPHTLNLWMREDGALIDRVALAADTNFQPRIGNSWHIPANVTEPGIPIMRMPFRSIFSSTTVAIYSGNQFQGGTNGANQLQTGSAIYYRNAAAAGWTTRPMLFHSQSGNNKYYSGAIPAGTFAAGDVVQYYLRIPYSDRLTTFLCSSNGVSLETEHEAVAQANPFSYAVLAVPPAGQPSPADWRDMNIYQIFTDRFCDGDPANNTADPEDAYNPASSLGIHGGDFKGIAQKMDYLKALGANAIWISPIPLTAGTNVAYHGYLARDFYQLAPHWGAVADLTNMVAAAHARGIYVILDVVCNHQANIIDSGEAGFPAYNPAGYNLRWTKSTNRYPQPFDNLADFHNFGTIANDQDATQVQLGDLRGLDDLKTETEFVRTNLVNVYEYWLDLADFDGFRLDASKHAEIGFWQHWNPEIRAYAAAKGKTNFFTYGENISGDAANGAYTGTKSGAAFANDSALDYPLYFSIAPVFAAASGNTKQIEDHYNALPAYYDPSAQNRLVTFLDNHDRTRFMSSGNANNNFSRLALALSFLYTSRGIPCLYQGTEQAFNGGTSPNNREDMFDGQFEQGPSLGDNFNMTHPAFLHVARLNNLRRLHPSLRTGTHVNLWNSPSGPGLFAYARRLPGEEVVVILNTSASSLTLTNRATSYPPGTPLVNLFNTNETIAVTANTNTPPVSVPGTAFKMFIAAALWKPLDPLVTNQIPSHATTGFSPTEPLTLQFSQPMDTNSVQTAFSISPPVAGTFSWNGTRDSLTFTPHGTGFAAQATNSVRLTNGVAADGATTLFAPFETCFVTAAAAVTDQVPPTIAVNAPAAGATVAGTTIFAGTAGDDVAVQKVEFQMDGGNWLMAAGTAAWNFALETSNCLNGFHALSARATDAAGNRSTTATVNVRFFNVPGAYNQRISAGNPCDVADCDGIVWEQDRPYSFGSFGYSGGTTGFAAAAISGICDQAQSLYQRERFGHSGFDYVFDCPPGVYEITLLDAETYWTGPNQRMFDVYFEGQPLLANFDIWATAGGMNIPVSLVFTATVADAHAELHFAPMSDSPRISGIQLKKTGDVDTDGDGIPDWWMLGYFNHPTAQEGDLSLAGDDPDEDRFPNLSEYIPGTDPLDTDSYIFISGLGPEGVALPSALGRLYQVEANGMTDAEWSVAVSNQSGNGSTLVVPVPMDSSSRWYRVRVKLP